jgi:hypothetical protein
MPGAATSMLKLSFVSDTLTAGSVEPLGLQFAKVELNQSSAKKSFKRDGTEGNRFPLFFTKVFIAFLLLILVEHIL